MRDNFPIWRPTGGGDPLSCPFLDTTDASKFSMRFDSSSHFLLWNSILSLCFLLITFLNRSFSSFDCLSM